MIARDAPYDAPYKGLFPYDEEDGPLFAGREREIELITANLLASRFTLLYGPSGVGKSSVLRAGVAYRLREQGQRALEDEPEEPGTLVLVFAEWQVAPLPALRRRLEEAALLQERGRLTLEGLTLADALAKTSAHLATEVLLILDQFEEYFRYAPSTDPEGAFIDAFAVAVGRRDLRAHFLIAIREDSLALLDRFKGRIPGLFENYLRIGELDEKEAESAIRDPLVRWSQGLRADGPWSAEPALVTEVITQLRPYGGLDAGSMRVGGISPAHLQIVLTRLFEAERQVDSRTLRASTLNDDLRGAQAILRSHLDEALARLEDGEKAILADVASKLVTASGTKFAQTASDLADEVKHDILAIRQLCERLTDARFRVLRRIDPPPPPPGSPPAEPRYEVAHDLLAIALRDWMRRIRRAQETERARREEQERLAEERREELRRFEQARLAEQKRIAIGVITAMTLALGVAGALGLLARKSSIEADEARSHAEMAGQKAVVLKIEADKAAKTATINEQKVHVALRAIHSSIELRRTFSTYSPEEPLPQLLEEAERKDLSVITTCRNQAPDWRSRGQSLYEFTSRPDFAHIEGEEDAVALVTFLLFERERGALRARRLRRIFIAGPTDHFTLKRTGYTPFQNGVALIEYKDPTSPPAIVRFEESTARCREW